ncbi:MAG: hypothetical protein ACXVB9_13960 [Bdellovibrionota bacterium]
MRKPLDYDFLLDYFPASRIEVKKMFGHQCLYFDGLMVMFLICKEGNPDNGICLATTKEHIASLGKELRSLRHLESSGPESTDWRLLPAGSPHFESDAERACRLILKRDPRIGREPKSRAKKWAK